MGIELDADNLLLLQGLPLDEELTEEDLALLRRYSRTFTGSYSHTLDGKGRMVIPQAYRDRLGSKFCIAPSADFESFSLYSNLAWARLRDRYARLSQLKAEVIEFQNQFDALSFLGQECDAQGRILLPARIRHRFLGDEKDVEVSGAGDHVRIVAATRSEEQYSRFKDQLQHIQEVIGDLDAAETLHRQAQA